MGNFRSVAISLVLLSSALVAQPAIAAVPQLITCTDFLTSKSTVLPASRKDCRPFQAKSLWQLQTLESSALSSTKVKQVKVCTSKRPQFTYQIIKAQCAKHQNTNQYLRDVRVPSVPIIKSLISRDGVGVEITLDSVNDESLSSPIAYYLVTNLTNNSNQRILIGSKNTLSVTGLAAATVYRFKVSAVNVDGISAPSLESSVIQISARTQGATTTVVANRYVVGDRGPGGGIIFYVAAATFTSAGSACNTSCKYLEVAPSTWQSGVVQDDLSYVWSTNSLVATGQDFTTASTEGIFSNRSIEKANWRIGQGFYNTSTMKVAGATSDAQAAVLAYAAADSSAGQWFIPSINELNELCKYAYGQNTGDPSVACSNSGLLKSTLNAGSDLGGFLPGLYWSSTEESVSRARLIDFNVGAPVRRTDKFFDIHIRPIRAL